MIDMPREDTIERWLSDPSLLDRYAVRRTVVTALRDCRAALDERTRAVALCAASLRELIEWHGAVHTEDCPQDDTCDCVLKPINDRANAALAAAAAAAPPAPCTRIGGCLKENRLDPATRCVCDPEEAPAAMPPEVTQP